MIGSRTLPLSLLLLVPSSSAFYLPGVAPTSYAWGDLVPLLVNTLTPTISQLDDQVHAVASWDYYLPAFGFCRPEGGPEYVRESLGSIIFGDRIQTSPFELRLGKDETCKAICPGTVFSEDQAKFVNTQIDAAYNVNFLVDGLPAAQRGEDLFSHEIFDIPGFSLGRQDQSGVKILHNHWDITISYHQTTLSAVSTARKYRIVEVIVSPRSIARSTYLSPGVGDCPSDSPPLSLDENGGQTVTYTYSVTWEASNIAWATRWDKYLHIIDPSIHWFGLISATIFLVLLLGLVSSILARALHKDIKRYNRIDNINLDDLNDPNNDNADDILDDSGWKLLHGDVFRSPRYPMLLSVLLGSGAQLLVMIGLTVLFALFGLMSPGNRGFLTTVSLMLYTFLGFVGGYVSSRCYKTYGGENWRLNMVSTPLLVPGAVFSTFFLMNLFVWFKGSAGAVPLTTMLVLVAIWFIISVPLSVAGSWAGFKVQVPTPPCKVNQIPRQIPIQTTTMKFWPSALTTGVLPFLAIFVELYPMLRSLWTGRLYYMFGFLFICYLLMILTTACTAILLVYFMLCAENYTWQWRSFIGAGTTGIYVFAISLWFWATRASFGGWTGAILYLGYSALISGLVFVLTGSIGFLASYWFLWRIYGSIKVD